MIDGFEKTAPSGLNFIAGGVNPRVKIKIKKALACIFTACSVCGDNGKNPAKG